MAKFVCRLSRFLAIFTLCLGMLIGFVIFMSKLNVENCRLNDSVDALILGDSHTMWAIDDSHISGLQNISLNGEGYKYSYKKLLHALESGAHLKVVYLGFSYHNLSGYFDQYINGRLFKNFFARYLSLMTLNDYIQLLKSSSDDLVTVFRNLVWEGKRAIKGECALFGGFPDQRMDQVFSRESMLKRISAQYYDKGKLLATSNSNKEYLEKIIELCKSSKIRVVLVSTPLHSDYMSHVPVEYVNYYDSFVSDSGLEVFEFKGMELSDNFFLPDGDHLNSNGAVKATEIFRIYHESN